MMDNFFLVSMYQDSLAVRGSLDCLGSLGGRGVRVKQGSREAEVCWGGRDILAIQGGMVHQGDMACRGGEAGRGRRESTRYSLLVRDGTSGVIQGHCEYDECFSH